MIGVARSYFVCQSLVGDHFRAHSSLVVTSDKGLELRLLWSVGHDGLSQYRGWSGGSVVVGRDILNIFRETCCFVWCPGPVAKDCSQCVYVLHRGVFIYHPGLQCLSYFFCCCCLFS
jgi:hypothetical protein